MSIFNNLDPLKHCVEYKQNGCSLVDGMLCNVKNCPYLRNGLLKKAVSFNDKSGFIIDYKDGYVIIQESDYGDVYTYSLKDINKKIKLIENGY